MIKFFRRIRYNLMEQNKTSKYFKYAIGEIVLVVIGILIALQINNWSEKNKLRTTETKILNELKIALERDLLNIKINIRSYKMVNRALEIIKEQLQLNKPTNDSLSYAFNNTVRKSVSTIFTSYK